MRLSPSLFYILLLIIIFVIGDEDDYEWTYAYQDEYESEDDSDYAFETSPYKTISTSEHALLQKKLKEFKRDWKLQKTLGDDNYEYIFEWNCFCATCLELPKYINIKDDKIVSIKFSDKLSYDYYGDENNPKSKKQFDLKLPNYGCDNLYLHSKHYHNMEGLFHILQQSLHPNYYDPNRHIISMTFDKKLHYPKSVYISNDLHELGWNIKCLSMSNNPDSKTSCSNTKPYPFWIEQKWQEIIGWFMLGLVLLMSCIGHFIAYLKKRARKRHRQTQRDGQRGGPIPIAGGTSNNNNNNDAFYDNAIQQLQRNSKNKTKGKGNVRNRKGKGSGKRRSGQPRNRDVYEERKEDSDETPIPDDH